MKSNFLKMALLTIIPCYTAFFPTLSNAEGVKMASLAQVNDNTLVCAVNFYRAAAPTHDLYAIDLQKKISIPLIKDAQGIVGGKISCYRSKESATLYYAVGKIKAWSLYSHELGTESEKLILRAPGIYQSPVRLNDSIFAFNACDGKGDAVYKVVAFNLDDRTGTLEPIPGTKGALRNSIAKINRKIFYSIPEIGVVQADSKPGTFVYDTAVRKTAAICSEPLIDIKSSQNGWICGITEISGTFFRFRLVDDEIRFHDKVPRSGDTNYENFDISSDGNIYYYDPYQLHKIDVDGNDSIVYKQADAITECKLMAPDMLCFVGRNPQGHYVLEILHGNFDKQGKIQRKISWHFSLERDEFVSDQ